MSVLSKFIKTLRAKRNISDQYIAQTMDMKLEEYSNLEKNPEIIPVSLLYKLFRALRVTDEEYLEFNQLLHCILYKENSPASDNKDSNVLEFKSKTGLNGRRKKKLTKKTDGEI